jgi:hypothetical protein
MNGFRQGLKDHEINRHDENENTQFVIDHCSFIIFHFIDKSNRCHYEACPEHSEGTQTKESYVLI